MPVIKITTNMKVDKDVKAAVSAGMVRSVQKEEEFVSHNILFSFQDDVWLEFRENHEDVAMLVEFHPGPMTPVSDYKAIVDDFFEVFQEYLPEIDPGRIYVTVSQIDHWGWNGGLLGG